jgi:hypothetical protein
MTLRNNVKEISMDDGSVLKKITEIKEAVRFHFEDLYIVKEGAHQKDTMVVLENIHLIITPSDN